MISKKFTKFYLRNFTPITLLEKKDQLSAKRNYISFTTFAALCFGFFSYRYRRLKVSAMEMHEVNRDPSFIMHMVNDGMAALLGYIVGHLMACDYTYKHR